ncbi:MULTISPECIES: lipopolysaccharide biosynthesis protein [unclassified Marinobacter]|uniref:lipopolysaccharide biosynthesis protein n=1 Tax=unclassified Marinobacter TaxID=83889 RepID=UPI0030094B1F
MSAKVLLSGSFLRLVALLTGMAISLFMMPFLVKSLGDHWYGLWVLVASTLGFYGVLDLGLSSATQRFISHALGQDDKPEMNSVLSNSLALFTGIGLVAAIITTVIALVSPLFFSSAVDAEIFRSIVLLMGFALALNFVMNAYNGVLVAYYRFDIQAKVTLFKNIFRALAVVLVFQVDPSVMNLALITVLFDLIGHWIILRSSMRQAPWISPSVKLLSKHQIKQLTGFGWFSFLVFVGLQIRNKGPYFIVASTLSIASVTVFQIANQLISYLNQLQTSVFGVLTPYFTKTYSQNHRDKLNAHYLLSLKLSAISASVLAGSMILLGRPFIHAWMGPSYDEAYLTLIPIAIGTYCASIHAPSFQLLQAMARHRYYSYFGLVEGILIIGVGIWATEVFGLIGIGYSIGGILGVSRFLLMPVMVSKITNISWRKIYAAGSRVTLLTILVHGLMWLSLVQIGIENQLFIAMPTVIMLYVVGLPALLYLSLTAMERQLVAGIIRQFLRKEASSS